jgi:hypothetical protein
LTKGCKLVPLHHHQVLLDVLDQVCIGLLHHLLLVLTEVPTR